MNNQGQKKKKNFGQKAGGAIRGAVGAVKKAENAINRLDNAVNKAQGVIAKINDVRSHPARSIGGAIGQKVGGNTGKAIGSLVGGIVGKITGSGDYKVTSNTFGITGGRVSSLPSFGTMGGGTRVCHADYITDVIASSTQGAFSATTYSVNPGLATTSPWIAPFANQFDQYKYHGCVFVFKSLTSEFAAPTTGITAGNLGTVVISSDYDVVDAQYVSKQEAENAEFSTSGPTTANLWHPIECKRGLRSQELYYTRSGAISTTGDSLRFYDVCNTQVITVGCPYASQYLGELWIIYDVEFFKPQLYGGILGKSILSASWALSTSMTTAAMFTGATASATNTTTGITLSADTITWPESYAGATWRVTIGVIGASTASVTPIYANTLSGGMSSTSAPMFPSQGTNWGVPSATATSTTSACLHYVSQKASPGVASSILYSCGTLPGTIAEAFLVIEQVSPTQLG
jgi:hypothetical protein